MANKINIGLSVVIIAIAVAYYGANDRIFHDGGSEQKTSELQQGQYNKKDNPSFSSNYEDPNAEIQHLYISKITDVQVMGRARVQKLLADDNEGSRHQKIIIDVGQGQTVLIAHNIDIAPRIEDLQVGDEIQYYGEYEYTEKGGVLHWTHHDPKKIHPHGWLKHHGKVYE